MAPATVLSLDTLHQLAPVHCFLELVWDLLLCLSALCLWSCLICRICLSTLGLSSFVLLGASFCTPPSVLSRT